MNLDQQQMYGIPDWRLPSPSSTPKSATVPDASLHTPRTDSLQSHFLEAWLTPRASVQQTPSQTPLFPRTRDRDRPLSSYSHKSQDPEDPEFHVNHYSPNPNLPLPPVEPSRRLASSPTPLKTGRPPDDNLRQSMPTQALAASNMVPSQMQTPPPTRDASSSRKRGQDGQPLGFNTPSTIYSRRDSAPAIPGNHPGTGYFGQDPGTSLFPNMQFTPEMSRFGHAGPSTAPGPSRTGIFFNPSSSGEMMHLDNMPAQDNPFAFSGGNDQNLFQWPNFTPTNTSRVDSASMAVANDSWAQTQSLLTTTSADLQSITGSGVAILDDPFVPTTSGVDPSMLFSFSGSQSDLDSTWISPQRPKKVPALEKRQPYEHQVRECERQREVSRKLSGHHTRTNTASSSSSSSASTAACSRPGLQRSSTHAGVVRKHIPVSESPLVNPSSAAPPVRKTSPLKRANQSALPAISEHVLPRPKTRLIVDDSGRARTETVRDGDEDRKQVDHRARYSGLWDDDSDSDSDQDVPIVSRSSSFSMPSGLTRSASKHGRAPGFMARSHSVKNPRSFSFTDNLSKRLGRLSTESTPRKPKDDPRRSSINSPFGGYLRKEDELVLEKKGAGDKGGAQDALKQVVADSKNKRQETTSAADVRMLEAHNQRWRASADVSKMNVGHGTLADPFLDSSTPSSKATEGSAFTPSTDRSSESSECTRCVCQSAGWDGQLMIQCESCAKWQHARCMGLPLKAELLPSVYVCIFCTGSTPVVRGGRARDPYRASHKPTSPLAYKHRQ